MPEGPPRKVTPAGAGPAPSSPCRQVQRRRGAGGVALHRGAVQGGREGERTRRGRLETEREGGGERGCERFCVFLLRMDPNCHPMWSACCSPPAAHPREETCGEGAPAADRRPAGTRCPGTGLLHGTGKRARGGSGSAQGWKTGKRGVCAGRTAGTGALTPCRRSPRRRRSPAQLSLAWCARNPHVSTVITGATKVSQVWALPDGQHQKPCFYHGRGRQACMPSPS